MSRSTIAYLALLLTLSVATVGSIGKPEPQLRSRKSLPRDLQVLKDLAAERVIAGDFLNAALFYEKGLQLATVRGDALAKARFLHGLGNCHLFTTDYRTAVNEYLEARGLAASESDWAMASLISANLYVAYISMGDTAAAFGSMQEAIRSMPAGSRERIPPHFLINMANAQSKQGNFALALAYFTEAIRVADWQNDRRSSTQAWSELGFHYLMRGELPSADQAYTRAFYDRKLTGTSGLADSYRDLGMLRVAQGDPASAIVLLGNAMAIAKRSPVAFPAFFLYFYRAQARAALNDLSGAMDDFETTLDLARRWRLDVVSTDSSRTGADVKLERIYSAYIETGMRLYRENHSQALAYKMFQAAEENRAVSFQERLNSVRRFPPEYWQILADLRRAEIVLFRNRTINARETVQSLRLKLAEVESRLQSANRSATSTYSHRINENNRSVNSLTPFQRLIANREALISFHLGEKESYVWAVTREGFEIHTLPARNDISKSVRAFQDQVRTGMPDSGQGNRLYTGLFGDLSPSIINKLNWILVLDDTLFQLPFGALITSPAGGPTRYLIERNSLRILPAAAMLAMAEPELLTGPFLGIGDPIYNTADSRWRAQPKKPSIWRKLKASFAFAQTNPNGPAAELSRLAGSGRELQASSGAWRSPLKPVLLQGEMSKRTQIEEHLRAGPAVAHFATHVVQTADLNPAQLVDHQEQAMIAIGLDASGQADFLTASEISSWRDPLGLVVLSGCSSGVGKALPGAGLFGLTRAWLLAGARAVIASQWPTPDDSGALFVSFYDSFRPVKRGFTSAAAANALRTAQIEMLRSGTWRAQPKFWAAFFVAGKD